MSTLYESVEYGARYRIDRGPSREILFDAVRHGERISDLRCIQFMAWTDQGVNIGKCIAVVEGIHRTGENDRLFLMGRLRNNHEDHVWSRAFFFAEYNLYGHKGYFILGPQSFLSSPLAQFGPYKDYPEGL